MKDTIDKKSFNYKCLENPILNEKIAMENVDLRVLARRWVEASRRLGMKYMLLIYYDEQVLEKVGKTEEARIERACLDHTERLNAQGKFLAANRLHAVSTATCV